MKKIFLSGALIILSMLHGYSQCSTTNATSCQCLQSGSTDCDLLPDMKVARPPLLVSGTAGVIEYSQSGNGSNDGLLRISVSTPNVGRGPLEVRSTNVYICGTDTFIGTAPPVCPDGITFPKNLITQRVYHKNGNVMTYYDRPAGTMTYHPQHGHMHVDNWGEYSLRKATSNPNPLSWPIYAVGAKLAFCLMDYGTCSYYNGHCVNSNGQTLTNDSFPNFGLGGGSYSCSAVVQGISSGFTDIYYQNLDGMWVDLPDSICNGDYFIVVNLDPYNYFLESDESNNLMAVPITLTKQQGTVPVITASGPVNFCQGSSVILASTAASNYLWSNGATTQNITVTTSGTYTVAVNTTSSCPSSSAPVQVTASALNVTTSATPGSLCSQGQAQLSSVLTGDSLTASSITFSNNNQYFIPDNNATGVQSPVTVSGINPATLTPSTFIQVQLNITHTYDADLIVYLISPSGNQIMLSNKRGGSGNDFINTVFATNATTLISNGSAPFTGTFVPDQSLSSLTGNVNGSWILKVTDVANSDTGRIQNWNIQFNSLSPSTHNYLWSSDPSGFSSSITNPIASLTQTTTYTVTVTNPVSGCQGSASVTVAVNSPPVVSFSGLNSSYLLSASPSNLVGSPPGGTFSGTGITGNTFDPAAAGIGGPYTIIYNYTDVNGCTNSISNQTTVTNCAAPAKPGNITSVGGNTKMCPGDSKTYSIAAVAGATSYLWTPPAGGVVSSGQGTTSATIDYTNGFVAPDSLKVAAVSICGTGLYKAIKIFRNNPAVPSVIAGATTGVCGGIGVPYSVTNVAGITYNWTNSNSNATISGGQGTSSITADFGAGYVTGNLKVTAGNGCGTSAVRLLTVKTIPAMPGDITGATTVCANQAGVPYSIVPVASATNYTWFAPVGSKINDGVVTSTTASLVTTASAITVNYKTTAGNVKVRANNSCGSSPYKTMAITFNCREFDEHAIDITLYPNPAGDEVTVSFNATNELPFIIKVNDILGKTLIMKNGISQKGENNYKLSLDKIQSGVYLVEIKSADHARVLKLVVN
ncbi:MAG: proprotein convertase P-domain-containing protein [Bacteroidia bacterium]